MGSLALLVRLVWRLQTYIWYLISFVLKWPHHDRTILGLLLKSPIKCMYVCMYVCMYACMHALMYVCMYACMHAWMDVCMHACMHACMYVCICLFKTTAESLPHFLDPWQRLPLHLGSLGPGPRWWMLSWKCVRTKIQQCWCFKPLWKILVKWDDYSQYMEK